MQFNNAIKKMKKVGEVTVDGLQAWVKRGGETLAIRGQKDWQDETKTVVVSIHVTNTTAVENDSNPMNGNCYTTYYDNMAQALKYF